MSFRCKVMGIVNVTPDSFSDGGKFFKPEEAIRRVKNLIAGGADVIDLGAESTRPGAQPIDWEEEWARLEPVLKGLAEGREARDARREQETRDARREPIALSIDTYHPETAERALQLGARMINCVYAEPVEKMLPLCREYGAELVVPATAFDTLAGGRETGDARREQETRDARREQETRDARRKPETRDARREQETRDARRKPETRDEKAKVWIDPMIGFGTTREEDLSLLRSIPELAKKGRVVVGVSRKRIVRRLSGERGVGKLLGGSVALAVWCAAHGASMVRVHDVRETVEALRKRAVEIGSADETSAHGELLAEKLSRYADIGG